MAILLLQEQLEALSSEKAGLDERTSAQLRSLQQQLSIASRERDRLQADLEQQVEGSAKVCKPRRPHASVHNVMSHVLCPCSTCMAQGLSQACCSKQLLLMLRNNEPVLMG